MCPIWENLGNISGSPQSQVMHQERNTIITADSNVKSDNPESDASEASVEQKWRQGNGTERSAGTTKIIKSSV